MELRWRRRRWRVRACLVCTVRRFVVNVPNLNAHHSSDFARCTDQDVNDAKLQIVSRDVHAIACMRDVDSNESAMRRRCGCAPNKHLRTVQNRCCLLGSALYRGAIRRSKCADRQIRATRRTTAAATARHELDRPLRCGGVVGVGHRQRTQPPTHTTAHCRAEHRRTDGKKRTPY